MFGYAVNDEPGVMLPGDCFTIEPPLIQGMDPVGYIFPDGWTVSTEVNAPFLHIALKES
ncbi:hypothetical protein C0993_009734 [Termitomyces sp. T159_Od127]|nr:hypothetical protein C0993_009734 [Termitomyces sp. T159_Od127]